MKRNGKITTVLEETKPNKTKTRDQTKTLTTFSTTLLGKGVPNWESNESLMDMEMYINSFTDNFQNAAKYFEKILTYRHWRDRTVSKSTGCSSTMLRFDSQHPHCR